MAQGVHGCMGVAVRGHVSMRVCVWLYGCIDNMSVCVYGYVYIYMSMRVCVYVCMSPWGIWVYECMDVCVWWGERQRTSFRLFDGVVLLEQTKPVCMGV